MLIKMSYIIEEYVNRCIFVKTPSLRFEPFYICLICNCFYFGLDSLSPLALPTPPFLTFSTGPPPGRSCQLRSLPRNQPYHKPLVPPTLSSRQAGSFPTPPSPSPAGRQLPNPRSSPSLHPPRRPHGGPVVFFPAA